MPKAKKYPCYTCGTDEPHRRPADERERNVIRRLTGAKDNAFVDHYWICASGDRDCRNIRTGGRVRPFRTPRRMPTAEEEAEAKARAASKAESEPA